MAANTNLNSSLNLVDLDFFSLKNSFKNYLQNQEQFKDYNFDGSSMNVLMELLAYNTNKNAFYLNMALNERFIDSAQLRNSLVSHAKELNYLPRSARSSKAKVKVTFRATSESQPYIIPKGSMFSTMIKSQSFTFTIPETITVASVNTLFTFTTDIYEGIYVKDSYIYKETVEEMPKFRITNKNVDTESITVTVYEDGSSEGESYTLTSTLLDLTELSKVFFVQCSSTGYYEIFFGDNILGYKPKVNSTIVIDYRVTNGKQGNGAQSFSVDFDPTGNSELTSTPTLEILEIANNGADAESDESIRYYAPRHFQVQERAVTTTDYEILLKNQFPEINAVTCFGGEEMSPPQFGKVFVVVDITDVSGLPEAKKDAYYNFLKNRSPLSIEPKFIEPEYMYLQINSTIRYNLNKTTNSANRIKTLVSETIKNYNLSTLNDFGVTYRESQLIELINNSDNSIVSNITDTRIYKKLEASTSVSTSYSIDFGVALLRKSNLTFPHTDYETHSVESSDFVYKGMITRIHDNDGFLYITQKTDNDVHKIIKKIGSVNYDTGVLTLTSFLPESYVGDSIKLYVIPNDKDVKAKKNIIMQVESDEIKLTTDAVRV